MEGNHAVLGASQRECSATIKDVPVWLDNHKGGVSPRTAVWKGAGRVPFSLSLNRRDQLPIDNARFEQR